MLYVDNRSRAGQFTSRDQELLDIFASQAAVTLENARMARDHARGEKLRVLGRLAGDVAHDFNNLLTAILGRAEVLLLKSHDPETRAGLSVIQKAARDGSEVVRHLQDLSRVHRGREREAVVLKRLIEDALEFVRPRKTDPRSVNSPVIPVVDVPDDVVVSGNPSELREVFTNLFLNSYSAMDEGGTLTVSAILTGDRAIIAVADSGIGMSEEVLESVFDPYFTTRGESGSGLGMSIARNIVDRHGGEIRLESAPLEGTRVIFDLPLHLSAPTIDGKGRTRADPRRPVHGRRVLLVEDESSIRELLVRVLSDAGFEVEAASGGLEAVARFEEGHFDAVMTDLGMSPCNGWEVAQRVKRHSPNTPVLLLTGWGAEIEPAQAKARGVDRILRKPFEVDHLIAEVSNALEQQRERAGEAPAS
jgi:CheY-like chemotaxis protein